MIASTVTVTRAQVVEEARKWIGVKWRHQGRNEWGVDCIGLIVAVTHKLRLTAYDEKGYHRMPTQQSLANSIRNAGCTRINTKDVQDGDILVFKERVSPCHVGIASTKYGRRFVLHSSARAKFVMEQDFAGELSGKVIMAFKMPGVV